MSASRTTWTAWTAWTVVAVASATALLSSKLAVGAGGSTAIEPRARADDVCAETAKAALPAARAQAHADFEIAIGNCLNDTLADPTQCRQDAQDELDAALVYRRETAEGVEIDAVTTLGDRAIATIGGFRCHAVHDVVRRDGVRIEDTTDWFAQRDDGTVWYFGELAKNYVDGFLDNLDGSFRTGTNGAKPGVAMEATPKVGDFYRQEFLLSKAEDLARVVALDETVTVPFGTFDHCLETEETTPLEPGDVTRKFYAKGIGVVLEVDLSGGSRNELIEVRG